MGTAEPLLLVTWKGEDVTVSIRCLAMGTAERVTIIGTDVHPRPVSIRCLAMGTAERAHFRHGIGLAVFLFAVSRWVQRNARTSSHGELASRLFLFAVSRWVQRNVAVHLWRPRRLLVSIRCLAMGTAELRTMPWHVARYRFLFAVSRWVQRNSRRQSAHRPPTCFYSLSRDGYSGTCGSHRILSPLTGVSIRCLAMGTAEPLVRYTLTDSPQSFYSLSRDGYSGTSCIGGTRWSLVCVSIRCLAMGTAEPAVQRAHPAEAIRFYSLSRDGYSGTFWTDASAHHREFLFAVSRWVQRNPTPLREPLTSADDVRLHGPSSAGVRQPVAERFVQVRAGRGPADLRSPAAAPAQARDIRFGYIPHPYEPIRRPPSAVGGSGARLARSRSALPSTPRTDATRRCGPCQCRCLKSRRT